MTRSDFYQGKSLAETEWWLGDQLPDLVWARLRVYDDGSADACFAEGVTVYGFESREFAGNFLAQDDQIPFGNWTEEEVAKQGLSLSEIQPPNWVDAPDQEFIYTGTYPRLVEW
jgi:hypothetical protein